MTSLLASLLVILSEAGRVITENVLVALIVMVGPILTTIVTTLLARRAGKKEGKVRDIKLDNVTRAVNRIDVAAVAATVPPEVQREITDSLRHRVAELENENAKLRNGG